MPPLASPLWCMFFHAESNRFVPRYVGKVEGVRGEEVLVAGKWERLAWPWWTSEAEARAYCEANGAVMPSVK